MTKMGKVAITATAIGMVAAMAAGNTNTLLANGFLMLAIIMTSGKD